MARLTEEQVSGLLDRLVDPDAAVAPDAGQDLEQTRSVLSRLCADGSLGKIVGQQLATYLNRPVRCTSESHVELSGERTTYRGRGNKLEYRLTMESLLAAALGDAMIGGEGDPSKVGLGSKALRVAAGAAKAMLNAIGTALELDPPVSVELEASPSKRSVASAGGTVAIAAQGYHWQATLDLREVRRPAPTANPQAAAHVARPQPAPPTADVPVKGGVGALQMSLEGARAALERVLHKNVTFQAPKIAELNSPAMPEGWLRIGVPVHDRGAVVVVADASSAAALLNSLLSSDVVQDTNPGVLAQTGVQAIAIDVLQAFVAALPHTSGLPSRVLRLTDDAILASLPHHVIEHGFRIEGRHGRFTWLVPSQLLRSR